MTVMYRGSLDELETVEEGRESLELNLPIQVHSRPATPEVIEQKPVRGRSLEAKRLDYDNDEHIIRVAEELGITVPPEPNRMLDLSEGNVSTVTVSSSVPETNTLQSRNSQSTRPTSCNSSEQHVAHRVNSPVMPSVASTYSRARSPTPSSSISMTSRSPYSKFRNGIRRLSTLTRRLSTAPSSPVLGDSDSIAPSLKSSKWNSRPTTARSRSAVSAPTNTAPMRISQYRDRLQPPIPARPSPPTVSPSLPELRLSAIYPPSTFTSTTPPPEEFDPAAERRAVQGRERSLRSRRLHSVRIKQLSEQASFLKFHFDDIDRLRSRHSDERRQAQSALLEKQEVMQVRHTERNADLESRHLAAEMDLAETLASERRACETKLKHMDAYCNNRQSLAPNGQPRKVTENDYRKLVEQYNIRNGMAALHESRINVLREKQTKQLERIAARQDAELEALQEQFNAEMERKDAALRREEAEMRRDFSFKKDKLVWRWKVIESVERKQLELEKGEEFGELPEVQWADEGWLKAAL